MYIAYCINQPVLGSFATNLVHSWRFFSWYFMYFRCPKKYCNICNSIAIFLFWYLSKLFRYMFFHHCIWVFERYCTMWYISTYCPALHWTVRKKKHDWRACADQTTASTKNMEWSMLFHTCHHRQADRNSTLNYSLIPTSYMSVSFARSTGFRRIYEQKNGFKF